AGAVCGGPRGVRGGARRSAGPSRRAHARGRGGVSEDVCLEGASGKVERLDEGLGMSAAGAMRNCTGLAMRRHERGTIPVGNVSGGRKVLVVGISAGSAMRPQQWGRGKHECWKAPGRRKDWSESARWCGVRQCVEMSLDAAGR